MKKSFTILELIIAIMIFSLVYLSMSNVIENLKNSESFIKTFYKQNSFNEKILKTLYLDLINSDNIKIVRRNQNFSTIYIHTTNSLYGLSSPFVVWYVTNSKNLIRIESIDKRLLPIEKTGYLYDFGKVKIFRIFQNKKKYFVFFKNIKPLYFEFYKE